MIPKASQRGGGNPDQVIAQQEHAEERVMRAQIAQEEQHQAPEIDLTDAHREAQERQHPWSKKVDLAGDFARAADDGNGEGGGGDDGAPAPRISRAERRSERARTRRRGRGDDFERER